MPAALEDPAEPPYRLNVIWHRTGQDAPRSTGAAITPGYSTPADLPDIIAIRYLAGKRERDQVLIDHSCRKRRWQLTARDTGGVALGQCATDDENLMPALAQALLQAVTANGTVTHVEVLDTDTETSTIVAAEPRADEPGAKKAGATVYLLSIAAFDCEPDDYEVGGTVMIAEIDLNTAFAGNAEPCSEDEALAFASNTLRQLYDFPARLRVEAHAIAAPAVERYPAAVQALSALLAADDAP
ncbi:MAG: hypothetical protein HOV83_14580, partial [Catenulispora sp.]|nr:hypothetical protein [Catenulispora sp.]